MRSIRFIVLSRFFTILVFFFVIFFVGSFFVIDNIIVQFMIRDNSASLALVINNIQRNYMSDLQTLDDLARNPAFNPFNKSKAYAQIVQLLRGNNIYSNLHVYNKNGDLRLAHRRETVTPYNLHKNFRDQSNKSFVSTAKNVINDGKSRSSPTFVTGSGQLFHTYVVPFFHPNSKHVAGIISGGVFPDGQNIDHLVEGLQLAEGNFIVVSDPHGHILAQTGLNTEEEKKSLTPFVANANKSFSSSALDKRIFIEASKDFRNNSYYFLSMPISDLQFVVTLGVGTQHIETKRQELLFYLVIVMVIGLLFGLVGSYLVGRKLAEPLHEVALSVEKMSLGDFSHRIHYKGQDEIGHLCFLINRLAIKLRKDRSLGELWVTRKEAGELVKHKHPES